MVIFDSFYYFQYLIFACLYISYLFIHWFISYVLFYIIDNRMHSPKHIRINTLQRRHNDPDGVSNHQPRDCLLNCLFRCRSKKTSKLRVTGLCAENSPGTGEFSAQKASNAENVFIWWRHHEQAASTAVSYWAIMIVVSCLQDICVANVFSLTHCANSH